MPTASGGRTKPPGNWTFSIRTREDRGKRHRRATFSCHTPGHDRRPEPSSYRRHTRNFLWPVYLPPGSSNRIAVEGGQIGAQGHCPRWPRSPARAALTYLRTQVTYRHGQNDAAKKAMAPADQHCLEDRAVLVSAQEGGLRRIDRARRFIPGYRPERRKWSRIDAAPKKAMMMTQTAPSRLVTALGLASEGGRIGAVLVSAQEGGLQSR